MLLLGLLLLVVGFIKLQTWFPSENLWQDFITLATVTVPNHYNWWDFMKYSLSFATISGLGFALAGFGIWLRTTTSLACKMCGYKQWEDDKGT
jgi:hypothetical protein